MIDDIRKQEDLTPINFPFIQLGLADVLYNPETGEIYTPNTDAVMNLKDNGRQLLNRGGNEVSEDIEEHAEELRYNPYHDPTNGRFTTSSGGGNSSKGLTGGEKSVTLDSKGNPYKYSQLSLPKKEYGKVMHEINTLYDTKYKWRTSAQHRSGNYIYRFEIHEFNEYNIFLKEKI